jgi:hypothetical protein
MTSRGLALALGVALVAVLQPANAAEVIKDGSFESTPPSEDNPNWDEGGIVFSPICDVERCTDYGGTAGPRTGKNWALLGGIALPDEQFVAQPVTIPPGRATLSFHLWVGDRSGNGLDVFRVFMDNTELFELFESDSGYGAYTPVSVDVSAYAGVGGPHDLSFEYVGRGGGLTNFNLDDISLQAGQAGAGKVTLKGPKDVAKGKKAKLKVTVQPCAGHAGETIDLFRGKKKIASAMSSPTCTATFKVKIKKTSSFRAVSPAGSSNKLKIRAR